MKLNNKLKEWHNIDTHKVSQYPQKDRGGRKRLTRVTPLTAPGSRLPVFGWILKELAVLASAIVGKAAGIYGT